MKQCWTLDPVIRPSFRMLREKLQHITAKELYLWRGGTRREGAFEAEEVGGGVELTRETAIAEPPPPTWDVHHQMSSVSTRTASCLCCIAFARQFSSSLDGPLLLPPTLPAAAAARSFLSVQVSFPSPPFSPPPPLLNMGLTGGEAGLFLHVCQVLPPFLHPSIIPGSLYHRVALHASVIPSSSSPGMVSGVGPSLCAKVPPVYRAPDFPPALLFNWTIVVWFFFLLLFLRDLFYCFFFREVIKLIFFNAVSSASNIFPSDWIYLILFKESMNRKRENLEASIMFILQPRHL